MFDVWHKIAEKGAVAVPLNACALTPLGWAEIKEVYPELVPDECRGCDVYSDPQVNGLPQVGAKLVGGTEKLPQTGAKSSQVQIGHQVGGLILPQVGEEMDSPVFHVPWGHHKCLIDKFQKEQDADG